MNLKKILVLLLSLAMVFSLAACSGGTDEGGSTDDGNTTPDATEPDDGGSTPDDGGEQEGTTGADSHLVSTEFITQSGANQDGQVDNVVIAMSSTSVNVGPFAPNSLCLPQTAHLRLQSNDLKIQCSPPVP